MTTEPAEISPAETLERHRRGEIQLVDVRTPEERAAGRIGAGDLHIEMTDLSARAGELHRTTPIVFYCRTGSRSGMATDAFRASGFEARNLAGGVVEWTAQGLPFEGEVA